MWCQTYGKGELRQRERKPAATTTWTTRSDQVRSGQCLKCTFRERCRSARLSRAQVPAFAGSSVWDRIPISSKVYMHHLPDRITHTMTSWSTGWKEKQINGSTMKDHEGSTYHSLCYTSPWRIDPTTHCTMSEQSYHGATSHSLIKTRAQ